MAKNSKGRSKGKSKPKGSKKGAASSKEGSASSKKGSPASKKKTSSSKAASSSNASTSPKVDLSQNVPEVPSKDVVKAPKVDLSKAGVAATGTSSSSASGHSTQAARPSAAVGAGATNAAKALTGGAGEAAHGLAPGSLAAAFARAREPIFSGLDKLAFWIGFVVSLIGYTLTLAPTVTLEDAGELVVASDYLGVPHPPGYPIWSLLSWFFQWIFDFVNFNGNPNPAWSVAFMSAFFGALAVGLMAMLISRSGRHIIEALQTSQGSIFAKPIYPAIGCAWIVLLYVLGSMMTALGVAVLLAGVVVLGVWFVVGYFFDVDLGEFGLPGVGNIGSILFGAGLTGLLCMALWTHRDTNLGIALALLAIAMVFVLDTVFGVLQRKGKGSIIDNSTASMLAFFAGLAGALLWAFTPVMWSQSVIVEVYSLNAFFAVLMLVLTYMWMSRPDAKWLLYTTAFAFGIGITNHHALIFFGPFLITGIAFRNKKLFVHALMLVLIMGALYTTFQSIKFSNDALNTQLTKATILELQSGSFKNGLYAVVALLLPMLYFLKDFFGPRKRSALMSMGTLLAIYFGTLCFLWAVFFFKVGTAGKVIMALIGLFICFAPLVFQKFRPNEFQPWPVLYGMLCLTMLGLGFHGYMAFASEQNPPMNWAYARTPNGFKHSITRGQYEKISVLGNIEKTLGQVREKGTKTSKETHLKTSRKDANDPQKRPIPYSNSEWKAESKDKLAAVEGAENALADAEMAAIELLASGSATSNTLVSSIANLSTARATLAQANAGYPKSFTLSEWRRQRSDRLAFFDERAASLKRAEEAVVDFESSGAPSNAVMLATQLLRTVESNAITAESNYASADSRFDALHKSKFFLFYQLSYFFFSPNYEQVFSMVRAFTPLISLLVLFALVVGFKLNVHMRTWFLTALIGFFSFTVLFLLFQYPNLTNQDLFIKRVQYIQAHGLWALFIAYGLIVLGTLLIGILRFIGLPKQTGWLAAVGVGVVCTLYFPWKQIDVDRNDPKHIQDVGSSAMNGHEFGWQFGFYQLRGANGVILDELASRERAGEKPTFLLNQAAFDYIAWSDANPDNLEALRPLISDTVMDQGAFKSVLRELEDRSWREKRLVREACAIAAYKAESKPVKFNEVAKDYLRRKGVEPDSIDLAATDLNGLTLGTQARGLTGEALQAVLDAGRFGARYEADGDAVLSLRALDQVDPTLVSEAALDELRAIASDVIKSEEAVREILVNASTSTNLTEAALEEVLAAARITAFETVPDIDPDYPPEMEREAIFYGGTDPGRFVPTYMIYSAKVREDVKLITQNALADHTYMNVMRDLYGKDIWMPSTLDSNKAFQQYYLESSTGQVRDNAQTDREGGRMQVQGVLGVMQINSHLTKYQHEKCKRDHAFYVEESYPIQWMYPYMKPNGLILQLFPEPVEITAEDIDNDMGFWSWYCRKLERDPKFGYDVIAQKTFSKLRGAIAGLYEAAGNAAQEEGDKAKRDFYYAAADRAYQESVRLFPQSPEANQKYGRLLIAMRQFDKVGEVMQAAADLDPENRNLLRMKGTADSLKRSMKSLDQFNNVFDQLRAQNRPIPLQYCQQGLIMFSQFREVANFDLAVKELSAKANATPPLKLTPSGPELTNEEKQLRVIKTCRESLPIRMEPYKIAVDSMMRFFPNDYRSHIEKAAYLLRNAKQDSTLNKNLQDVFALLRKSVALGGNAALQTLNSEKTKKFAYLSGNVPNAWNALFVARRSDNPSPVMPGRIQPGRFPSGLPGGALPGQGVPGSLPRF